jgi:uncharacterized protein YbjT (DUF2867 family)
MSIVITAPTGNIGRPLTQNLLDLGVKPVLIARDAAKVKHFTDQGATAVVGSHSDPAVIIEATKGADALWLLTPVAFQTDDLRAFYRTFGEAAAKAIEQNDIGHVVHLSSVGAEHQSGTGPIVGLYENENILGKAAKNLVNLRPGYFMENTLGQVPSILQANALFTTFAEGIRFPMIATKDIAARAAELLTKRDWSGQKVVELQGAGDVGYEEVAGVLSEVLGRDLKHITVTPEQQLEALTNMGISATLAGSFHELSQAITSGHVKFHEPRSKANTTPTSYPVFAQEVFKPVFEGAAAG